MKSPRPTRRRWSSLPSLTRALACASAGLGWLAVLACSGPAVPHLDSPGSTIVCLGDSLTEGVGAGPDAAYPVRLAAELGLEPGEDVINAGVSGDTTAGGLARLDSVLAHDPWLVVVELGGNDLLHGVPRERIAANLDAIVERLLAAQVVPLLVEIRHPLARGELEEVFGEIADRHGVPLVRDLLPGLLVDPAMKSDPIHLNARGYERLAEGIAEAVEPLVAARERAG